MKHLSRHVVCESLQYLLSNFPCVSVIGSRQVGKTTLMKDVLPEAKFFDLEKRSDFMRISQDCDFFLEQEIKPVVIDEAQLLPDLFPALRYAIDQNRHQNGQFLLSGSSSPELIRHLNESLAGRMAVFELHGFSLEEAWAVSDNLLYQHLFEQNLDAILNLKPQTSYSQLLKSCCYGGYPESFLKSDDSKLFGLWMENYFSAYIKRDIRHLFPRLNIENYQRFILMLARSSGEVINASNFARSLDVSQPTVKQYLDMAHGTFVWRMIPSFQKNVKKRIIKMPKGQMRDSGLMNHILQNHTVEHMQSHPHYGRIFESFVIEQILKGFGNRLMKVTPYYYRTQRGAEIDLILEGRFGVLPIEIKSGTSLSSGSLTNLKRFIQEHGLKFGVVVNNAKDICWCSENILQIPAIFL